MEQVCELVGDCDIELGLEFGEVALPSIPLELPGDFAGRGRCYPFGQG